MTGKRQFLNSEKRTRGTYRRGRDGDDELRGFERAVITDDAALEIPESVSADEIALAFWHEIVPQLVDQRLITRLDIPALAQLCEHHSAWRRAIKTIIADGQIYETETASGALMIRRHPAVAIGLEAGAQRRMLLDAFGMSPAARLRVKPLAEGASGNPEVRAWMALKGGLDGRALEVAPQRHAALKPRTPVRQTADTPVCECGDPIEKPKRGPMPMFCSDRCRKRASRSVAGAYQWRQPRSGLRPDQLSDGGRVRHGRGR